MSARRTLGVSSSTRRLAHVALLTLSLLAVSCGQDNGATPAPAAWTFDASSSTTTTATVTTPPDAPHSSMLIAQPSTSTGESTVTSTTLSPTGGGTPTPAQTLPLLGGSDSSTTAAPATSNTTAGAAIITTTTTTTTSTTAAADTPETTEEETTSTEAQKGLLLRLFFIADFDTLVSELGGEEALRNSFSAALCALTTVSCGDIWSVEVRPGSLFVDTYLATQEAWTLLDAQLRAGGLLLSLGDHTLFARLPPDQPADCVWQWGAWGGCSKTCGAGTMSRVRIIYQPAQLDGVPCPDNPMSTAPCSLQDCAPFTTSTTAPTPKEQSSPATITTTTTTPIPQTQKSATHHTSGVSSTAIGVSVLAGIVVTVSFLLLVLYYLRSSKKKARQEPITFTGMYTFEPFNLSRVDNRSAPYGSCQAADPNSKNDSGRGAEADEDQEDGGDLLFLEVKEDCPLQAPAPPTGPSAPLLLASKFRDLSPQQQEQQLLWLKQQERYLERQRQLLEQQVLLKLQQRSELAATNRSISNSSYGSQDSSGSSAAEISEVPRGANEGETFFPGPYHHDGNDVPLLVRRSLPSAVPTVGPNHGYMPPPSDSYPDGMSSEC